MAGLTLILQVGYDLGRLAPPLVAWTCKAVSEAAAEAKTMNTLKKYLAELQDLEIATYGKDFLLTWEKTDDEIRALTLVAECFYQMHKERKPFRVFIPAWRSPSSATSPPGPASALPRPSTPWAWAFRNSTRRSRKSPTARRCARRRT